MEPALQEHFNNIQDAYSVNAMMLNLDTCYEIFKFLLGEQAKFCDFKNFLYFYHKNDADLVSIIADYTHENDRTNVQIAVAAAKQLFSVKENHDIQKSDFDSFSFEYIDGDQGIFNDFVKNFEFSKKKALDIPGKNSKNAYFISYPQKRLFVKPTEDVNKALNETKTYALAKKMGLAQYLMPSCAIKLKKHSNSIPMIALVIEVLPQGAVSLQDLDKSRPGAADGIIKSLIEKGDAHKLATLDYLVSNYDRHKGNVYVKDGRVFVIDHTECFKKRENGFVPGYLRSSAFKRDKRLPVCQDEHSLELWMKSLDLEQEYTEKLEVFKKSSNISKIINKIWEAYIKD